MRAHSKVLVGLGLAALLAALPARADHHMGFAWSGDLGVGYDDNIGNARQDEFIKDDMFVSAGANLDFHYRPTLYTALLVRSSLRGDGYEEFDGLSSAKLTEMVRVSHKPGGGFYTPTVAAWASAAVQEFDSALRDGTEFRGGAFVSEPITTTITARLSAGASERNSDSPIFDLASWSVSLDLDWQVMPRLTVYAGYLMQDGELTFVGDYNPGTGLPWGPDDIAEDDEGEPVYSYQVDAKTRLLTFGCNVPISTKLAIDAQVRRADAETDGGTRYDRLQGTLSALMRF